ncbi:hypothetical protein AB0E00_24670 [Streptomyces sp. NPDC048110]|uniref:hypothetical protein n=1 Tax=Streptomyces sp. NPDC048110 TaxID=3155483 RepID=UPI0033C3157F
MAQAVEAKAARHGWFCVVTSTGGGPHREAHFIRLMREEGVRAVIIVGGAEHDTPMQALGCAAMEMALGAVRWACDAHAGLSFRGTWGGEIFRMKSGLAWSRTCR